MATKKYIPMLHSVQATFSHLWAKQPFSLLARHGHPLTLEAGCSLLLCQYPCFSIDAWRIWRAFLRSPEFQASSWSFAIYSVSRRKLAVVAQPCTTQATSYPILLICLRLSESLIQLKPCVVWLVCFQNRHALYIWIQGDLVFRSYQRDLNDPWTWCLHALTVHLTQQSVWVMAAGVGFPPQAWYQASFLMCKVVFPWEEKSNWAKLYRLSQKDIRTRRRWASCHKDWQGV